MVKKGFGIIEVLISAVIIGVILVSASILGRNVLRSSVELEKRAQALYLAQEGLEMMRQNRDTNWVDGKNIIKWDSFDLQNSATGLLESEASVSGVLKFDNVYKRMKFERQVEAETLSVGRSDFKRTITLEKSSNGGLDAGAGLLPNISGNDPAARSNNSIKVTCTVSWQDNQKVVISEILTNWRPNY